MRRRRPGACPRLRPDGSAGVAAVFLYAVSSQREHRRPAAIAGIVRYPAAGSGSSRFLASIWANVSRGHRALRPVSAPQRDPRPAIAPGRACLSRRAGQKRAAYTDQKGGAHHDRSAICLCRRGMVAGWDARRRLPPRPRRRRGPAADPGIAGGDPRQAVTLHPENPEIVYVGTQDGPYRSTDRGEHWERLGFPDRGMQVWSILVDPKDPSTLYAGTSPVAVYRSEDGGGNWRRLADPQMPDRVRMPFACRVMRLAKDPERPAEIYAVLEVNGVMRSLDNGESWEDCSTDLIRLAGPAATPRDREGMLDGHALSVSPALSLSPGPSTVFLAVRNGLFRSADRGSSWQDIEIGRFSPLRYGRDIRVSPHDPRVLYACLSPAAQSTDGALYRSDDTGSSWRRFDRGVKAEATMMGVALHPRDPDQVYGVTRCGQIVGTRDGGYSWHEHRLPAGCEDTYAIACG